MHESDFEDVEDRQEESDMEKKQAILLVSFGTSVNETRKKTIDKIEEEIGEAFPQYSVYRAWTSKKIIEKVQKRDGKKIMTVEEALERIKKDGVARLIIQPTHMIDGIENEEMKRVARREEKHFQSLSFGKPLLTDPEDYVKVVKAVMKEFSHLKKDEALVLMGHGSAHRANSVYAVIGEAFQRLGYPFVSLGTVEAFPDFSAVLRRVDEQKPAKIWLAPFMVVAGDHALNDMAGEDEDSWKKQFEKAGFSVDCVLRGLGEYQEIRQIYMDHVRTAEESL